MSLVPVSFLSLQICDALPHLLRRYFWVSPINLCISKIRHMLYVLVWITVWPRLPRHPSLILTLWRVYVYEYSSVCDDDGVHSLSESIAPCHFPGFLVLGNPGYRFPSHVARSIRISSPCCLCFILGSPLTARDSFLISSGFSPVFCGYNRLQRHGSLHYRLSTQISWRYSSHLTSWP